LFLCAKQNPAMIIFFTQYITPRLAYIVKTILGKDTIITQDVLLFSNSSLQKINYSSSKFDTESLWIVPIGLLEENTITPQQINFFKWNNLPAFYKTNGTIPFDVFAASFYLLTRYEEYYDDYKTDAYGNYHHTNSIAFKENFLQVPLINLWINEIEKQYKLQISNCKFQMTPTYDVDIAFAYKHHSLLKNIGSFIKDLFHKRGTFKERFTVICGYKKDPYDVFNWLHDLHAEHHLIPIYFFLVAKNRSEFDKNSLPYSNAMKALIKVHSDKYNIGIHPSFVSNKNAAILKSEINYLQKVAGKKNNIARQHYLQLKFPETYQTFIQQGITVDYTMGYGTSNGFRASYTKPYYWYNLVAEKETNLLLHPFCYMDANSIFEQQISPQNALDEMIHYYNIVKQVKGEFIFIMHNHFLANQPHWMEWKNIYEKFLIAAKNN